MTKREVQDEQLTNKASRRLPAFIKRTLVAVPQLATAPMLCDNCQKNEATLHLTTILYGREEETIQLCQDCDTEATRLPPFDPSKLQLLPIIAKKCDFCGQDAFSEKTVARNSIYLCFDCQVEYRRTFAELFFCEHADFIQRIRTRNSSPPFPSPEQFQSWLAEADEKVVQILKERRRQ